MIYHDHRKGAEDRERRVYATIGGHGAHRISLDLRDFQDLMELGPEDLHNWLGQTMTRLLPEGHGL